jgi:hypothetical protein
MLTVAGLGKSFGGRELFDDVLFTIQSGESRPRRDPVPAIEAEITVRHLKPASLFAIVQL